MQKQSTSLIRLPTMHLAGVAVAFMGMGMLLGFTSKALRMHLGIPVYDGLQTTAIVVTLFGYVLLWLLLPVSAFRPEDRFILRGDWMMRTRTFGRVLVVLVIVHLWLSAMGTVGWT